MTVQMIASKRFRMGKGKDFRSLDVGDPYEVDDEKAADFHESTGRGKRAKPKTTKGADK